MKRVLLLVVFSAVSIAPAFSQSEGLPLVIQIVRESLKQGKGAAHERVESDWAKAMRKAKFPGNYLGLSTMSGPGEAWFISGSSSFAAFQEYQKVLDTEPLKSEVEGLESRDGALRDGSRVTWALYRKDLSYRPEKLNVGKTTRFVSLVTARVRLGKDLDMETGAKAILGALQGADLEGTMLGYQVVAGAPSGTYLFFGMLDSMKTIDGFVAQQDKYVQAIGADAIRQLMRGVGDIFLSLDVTLFSVNPKMSYVPKAAEDADPDFWRPKAAAAKPAASAQKGAEKPAAKK